MRRWAVNPAVLDRAIRKAEVGMRRPLSHPAAAPKASKYGNKRTVAHGKKFDSKREADRYGELLLLEKAGRISELTRQTSYQLEVNGVLICRYVCDASYIEDGKRVVEDTKGMRTAVYKLKKKLMLALLGIEIKET